MASTLSACVAILFLLVICEAGNVERKPDQSNEVDTEMKDVGEDVVQQDDLGTIPKIQRRIVSEVLNPVWRKVLPTYPANYKLDPQPAVTNCTTVQPTPPTTTTTPTTPFTPTPITQTTTPSTPTTAPPFTTTTSSPPTPHMKLIKKTVITLEEFVPED